jgi:hypothetical protein
METVSDKEKKPANLETDLRIWLDILQLWRSHLGFLKIRLSALNQRNSEVLARQDFDKLAMGIQYFTDSVITDYQEALRTDLRAREGKNQSLSGVKWQEEHDLFERHMKQLRSEYHKLLAGAVGAISLLEEKGQ